MEKTNNGLILLDLFSGTGGFHKGLSDAGFNFDEVYYSEVDKHAIANYKYNHPNAKDIGSVENVIQSGINRPHIITFGSPCQDFSLAGNRQGLAGNKSSLITYAIAAVSHFQPDLFIWENVKGMFSSNSRRDFWAIIQAFANIRGYRFEWQLVNTSWILPQNRERIYLIGHLISSFRNWRTIFPITENDRLVNEAVRTNENGFQTEVCGTILSRYGGRPTDTYVKTSSINIAGKIWNGQDGIVVNDNGLCPTISAGHGNTPKVLQAGHGFVANTINSISPTITANSFEYNTAVIQLNPSTESNGKQPYQHNRMYDAKGLSPCLAVDARSPIIDSVSSIRRLTEIECERLQGFPDNWTQFGNYDEQIKAIPKTQRYKLLGNAVTATMVQAIGQRLLVNFNKAEAKCIQLYPDLNNTATESIDKMAA